MTRTRTLSLVATVLWLAGPAVAQVHPPEAAGVASSRYAAQIDSARALVQAFMATHDVVGLSVAVGAQGEMVWTEGFGYADLENRSPVTPATKFRIGSIAKSLTSVALGQLYEGGRLDLDAPVQRYVPSFPEKRAPITTRQLAGHIAGVRHYDDGEFYSAVRYPSLAAGLAIFADDTLLYEPGTRYRYSTYGWNLIAVVIEGASGEDYRSYMREHVLEPLGLHGTVEDDPEAIVPWRSRFYERAEDGTIVNAPYVDNLYKLAAGGYLSTARDITRFGCAMVRSVPLQPETVRLLWTSQQTADGELTGYGIGWRVGLDRDDRRVVSHSGGSVGGRSMLLIYPDGDVVVVVTANTTPLDYRGLPEELAALFLP
ncbi:MAG: beta-lactamase family protein [Gemmatimonadota bacterium]|nr:MAG: beta-lactamase family protein [Gemmatimonadota bacterium]